MKKIYKWGIIGPGNIAHKFAQDLQHIANAQLLGVASRSTDRARDFAKQYGATKYYSNYEHLCEDPDIDIVYIATPHAMHHENTLSCLARGKAVLCEKPLAMNLRQVEEMVEMASKKNVFLMEAIWTRFLPGIIKLQEVLESGRIGDVLSIKADFGYNWPFDPKSRVYNPDLGGGSLLDIGIYPLFLSLFLLGQPWEIKSKAKLASTQVDADCEMELIYLNKNQRAHLFSSVIKETKLEAVIEGSNGNIKIPGPWFKPESLIINAKNEPEEILKFEYTDNGYSYEAIEAMNCLDQNKQESELLPWSFSLTLMKMMDEIRNQCQIRYPKYD
ncbi:Gfo/Idh/MocA family oxidoreductase [Fulvivirgaceae bacterium BMA10]|uniref:Gfo/Idh/MocA family oxidoreductase n=1 Tax=Splendidivirga corallicola TaxID=3051826 RepID=A0ABT8KMP1_9BACT|nr:Gfo/Idh/MocA family oxidoreductase [Fulvivirgaceae bacterium BMA10]